MSRSHLVLKSALCVALAVSLSQCGGKPKSAATATEEAGPTASYSYDVALTFTPAATARLKAKGQKAELSAYYFGAPTDAGKDKVNEAGEIEMGENLIAVDGTTQTVHVDANIDAKALGFVAGGQPSVLVTAWLDPTAGANALKCTTFKGTVADAKAKPVAVSCDVK